MLRILCAAFPGLVFVRRLLKCLGLLGAPGRRQLLAGVLGVAFLDARWRLGARLGNLELSLFLSGRQRVIGLAPLRPVRQRQGVLP
jgi:hypothetical protein